MKKARVATYIANIVDHFDSSLYGFLVPIVAPLFFPSTDPVITLIEGYGIFIMGFLTRPLGAWYFSKRADSIGPSQVLLTTILGMTIATFCFTLLQPHEQWGIGGALGLFVLRGAQNFFGAGETSIAGLYVLEKTEIHEQSRVSSTYLSSQMLGILMASATASIILYCENPQMYWKWPFYGSLVAGIFSWWLRLSAGNNSFTKKAISQTKIKWKGILRLVPITGFSYILYSAPFVFFNVFANLVAKIDSKNLMASSTGLMIYDLGILLILGPLLKNIEPKKILQRTALAAIVLAPLVFFCVPHVGLIGSIILRLLLVTIGVVFCIPLTRWYLQEFEADNRFTTTALGYAIGSETLGRSFPAVGLCLWHLTHLAIVPGLYIGIIGLGAYFCIKYSSQK